MNKLVLFTLLVACGSVLADTASDCAALTTSATCAANTSCTFTTASTTCTDKCNALSTADCTTNSTKCDSVAAACGLANCSQYDANKTGCTGASTSCGTYIDAVPFSCAVNASGALTTWCNSKTADKPTCEADAKCTFTANAGTFKSCDYKAAQCGAKAEADCDAKFCTKTTVVCQAKYTTDNSNAACSTLLETPCKDSGTAGTGCSWDATAGACVDDCAAFVTTATCTPSTKCSIKTPYSCADNAVTGQTNCVSENDATKCNAVSAFCSIINNNTCVKSDAYCTSKNTAATCTDTTNCTANTAVTASCPNKVAEGTCTALVASDTCGANAACKWTAASCKNKTATKCATTDASAACTDGAKFCTFAETGTCGVSSTSSSILAVSLIAIIALI